MRRIADYLVYLLVRIFICVVQSLSPRTCERMSRALAKLFNDVLRIRGRVVDENLRQAFPELDEAARRRLSRRMWEHLFLMIAEIAYAPRKIHDTNWRDHIRFRDTPGMIRRLYSDRPCVFVSGHFGNFELAGYTLGLFGFPTFSVARPLDNVYLNRFVNEFRGAKGQHVLPKNGSAQEIDRMLAVGATLSLLGDQNAGPKGCWVDFFGREASTHKAIALFSLSKEAPLIVSSALRVGRMLEYEIGAEATIDPRDGRKETSGVRELTQWFSTVLEHAIRRMPHQYWWLHRRWKDDRPQRGRGSKTRTVAATADPLEPRSDASVSHNADAS